VPHARRYRSRAAPASSRTTRTRDAPGALRTRARRARARDGARTRPRAGPRRLARHGSFPETPVELVQVAAVRIPLERRLEQLAGRLPIAERPAHIHEMRRDLRVGLEAVRPIEVIERRLVVAELEQHPAHAVDDRRVI